jgi:hypothetical protein
MEKDAVEQAHEIYFNVIVTHGSGEDPWTPDQRAELRRALTPRIATPKARVL